MDKGRQFLYIGAGLLLFSMPLTAFSFNDHGTDTLFGFQVWYLSTMFLFDRSIGASPIFLAMGICALFNLAQLIFPFLRSPIAGTSKVWRWTFSAVAFLILPALTLFFQFDEHRSLPIHREGYIVYQAGYIFSTLGFWKKAKTLEGLRSGQFELDRISSSI